MKIKSILAFLMLLLAFSFNIRAQQKNVNNNESNYAYADSIMQATYKYNEPGAVLLIAKDGYPVFEKAYGLANMELQILNRPDYEFEIGSNTKQFTAVSILQLVQEGKMALQDDIHKYLPAYNTHGRSITIENLLTHTSGIPNFLDKDFFKKKYRNDEPRDSIAKWFSRDSLLFEPGTDWSYSNSGFFLLGQIIEKVSGMSYEEYVQKNIFNPLHMDHSYFGTNAKVIPGVATGYEAAGNNKYKDADYISWSWPYAAGEIISNVADLLKWDNALYTDKIVSRALLQKAWTSYILKDGRKTQYGFGWFSSNYNGVKLIFHSGGIPGFLSMVIRLPEQHLFVTLLSNNGHANLHVAMPIALSVAGYPVTRPLSIKPDPALLKDYTGVYKIHALGTLLVADLGSQKMYDDITQKNDTLFIQQTGGGKKPLSAIAKDVFISSDTGTGSFSYWTYHFTRNSDGKVNAITVEAPLNVLMSRTEPKVDLP
ncbi:MAG TPA: serine hydrolase [Hanamia sp.]|nr:serine hydrolase [Hanamia sp.]